jgi:hypothetical protein
VGLRCHAEISISIIAVTGLAGHAFGSWAVSSHVMWLRDILPVDFPNARVLTYGYGSELQGGLSGSIIAGHDAAFRQKLKLWRADAPVISNVHTSMAGLC